MDPSFKTVSPSWPLWRMRSIPWTRVCEHLSQTLLSDLRGAHPWSTLPRLSGGSDARWSLRTSSVDRGCHTLILTAPHYRARSQALDSSSQHRRAVHVPQNRYTWSEWACGCVGVEEGGTKRKTRAGSNSLPLLRSLGLNADGELGLGRYTHYSRWDWSWRLPGSVVPKFFWTSRPLWE